MPKRCAPNIHPGEVLLEEFLGPLGISPNALARAAAVPPRRINEIVLGKRGISADTALRLAAALGTSERSGSACRRTMIWKRRGARWAMTSSGLSGWRRDGRETITQERGSDPVFYGQQDGKLHLAAEAA